MALTRTPSTDGQKLGRYELLRELHTSNVGASWLAAPDDEVREVTVHKVFRHMAKAPSVVEGFVASATSAKSLTHANVISVLDAGVQEGEPFVAVEYGGESLANVLKLAGAEGLPVPVALRISLDVIEAFAAAHAHTPALGHGELGPWCVFVGSDGVSRVSGFQFDQALVRFGPHHVKNLDRLAYAAPERVRAMSSTVGQGLAAADELNDVFSVGVLVFELLTKQRLFASKMEAAVVQKVLTSTIPAANSVYRELPAEVSDALKRALSRDRAERFKTFREFGASLEAGGHGLIAPAETVAELIRAARTTGKPSLPPGAPQRTTKPFSDRMSAPSGSSGVMAAAAPLPSNAATRPGKTVMTGTPNSVAGPNGRPETARADTLPGAGDAPPATTKRAPRGPAKTLLGFGKDLSPVPPSVAPPAEDAPASGTYDDSNVRPSVDANGRPSVDANVLKDEPARVGAEKNGGAPANGPGSPLTPFSIPSGGAPSGSRKRTATLMGIQAPAEIARARAAEAKDKDAKDARAVPPPVPSPKPSSPKAAPPPPKAAPPPAVAPPKPAPAANADGRFSSRPPSSEPAPKATITTRDGATGKGIDQVHAGAILEAQGTAYELIAPVARGGMAIVWAAREVGSTGDHGMGARLGNMVAIKTMLPELIDEEDFEFMFLDESRVAAKIRHRNVAGILGLGQADDLLYLAMEWVDGETLSTLQQSARSASGPIPANIIINVAAQISAGLYAAHQLKDDKGNSIDLVHRDISPANVLLSRQGVAKIVDFGIAKSKGRMHVTRASGLVKGKTPYLSPEQIGGLPIDHRSDLFSLGVLLYVLSTGKHPFRGETEIQTLENIAIHAPKPLREVESNVPPGLERIVLKLLEKDPKRRYQTAHDVELDMLALEATLAEPATEADVAAFVVQAIGDKLDARRQGLEAALEAFSPSPKATTPAAFSDDPTLDERSSGANANQAVEEIEVQRSAPAPKSPSAPPVTPEAKAEAAAANPVFPAPGALPVFDFPNEESVDAPAPVPATSPTSSGNSTRPPASLRDERSPQSDPMTSSRPSSGAQRRSGGSHLFKLVALGVVLGLLVIGAIEIGTRLKGTNTPAPADSGSAQAVDSSKPAPKPSTNASAAVTNATPLNVGSSPPPVESTSAAPPPSSAPSAAVTAHPLPNNSNRPPLPNFTPPPNRPANPGNTGTPPVNPVRPDGL